MIEFHAATKAYGGHRVIDGVSFTVQTGNVCALIGPSGSGKSTLLRMVNRLVDPDAGNVRVDGIDVTGVAPDTLRRKIGYVIQAVGLFPHWTVADNVAAVPRLLKWPEERIRARVAELLDLLRLDPALVSAKFPHELSGGQQQRVGVARALAADPDVLLMDEPFGALDPITRADIQDELARIQAVARKTILIVSHDMDEALRLADTLAILDHGRLVRFGSPREIVDDPGSEFVQTLIGRADLGLKRLAVRQVAERVRRGETAPGTAITDTSSLREALSQMVARGVDRLPVRNTVGAMTGVIHLADVVRP